MGEMAEERGQLLPATLNLHESLTRAEEYAVRRKHSVVGLDHLLLALIEDQDAASLLVQCHVDLKGLCADLLRKLGPEARILSPNPIPPTLDITIQNLLSHASYNARETGHDMMTGANVISVILAGEGGMITHKMLTRHGLNFEQVEQKLSTAEQNKQTPKNHVDQPQESITTPPINDRNDELSTALDDDELISANEVPVDLEIDDEEIIDDTFIQAEAHPSDYGTSEEGVTDHPVPPSGRTEETKGQAKPDTQIKPQHQKSSEENKTNSPDKLTTTQDKINIQPKTPFEEKLAAHKQNPVPIPPSAPPVEKPIAKQGDIPHPPQADKKQQPVYDNLAQPPEPEVMPSIIKKNNNRDDVPTDKFRQPPSDQPNLEVKKEQVTHEGGALTKRGIDQGKSSLPPPLDQSLQPNKGAAPPVRSPVMHPPNNPLPPYPHVQQGMQPMQQGGGRRPPMQPGPAAQNLTPGAGKGTMPKVTNEQLSDTGRQRMDDIATSIQNAHAAIEAANDQIIEFIPKVMRQGKAHFVEVRVARFANSELDLGPENYGLLAKNDAKPITKAITVRLTGPDGQFLIDSITPSTQWSEYHASLVEDADFAIWRWRIYPLRRGKSKLRLDVTMRTSSENGLTGEIPVQPSRTINVKVTRNYLRLAKRLIAIILIFAAGFAITKYGPDFYSLATTELEKLGLLKYLK